ncbi:MAG: hypothetical protein PHD31_02785, partial [Candidatus Pacebacteria bacterium]|nr:hypothetical protein [Candidatus Paceibacterota bacterium]
KILEEELGITEFPNQFSLAASVAIPAILRGIMKFRGAAAEMEMTMGGLLSSIHDYFLFIARDIFSGFFDAIKQRLVDLRKRLSELWEVFDKFGLEGLIANLFPRDMAILVWQLLAAFKELGHAISELLRITAPFRQELIKMYLVIMNWVVNAFTILIKIINILNGVATKATIVSKIFAAALVGLSVASATSAIIIKLVGAFVTLTKAGFRVVRIMGLLIGLLVALALTIPKVQQFFANLGTRILKLFGIQIPQSIMVTQAAINGISTDALEDIDWQKLIDGFSDVEEGANDAADAINKKFLASFDEVYAIPEENKKLDIDDILSDLTGIDFDLGGGDFGLDEVGEALEEFSITWQDILERLKSIWKIFWNALVDVVKIILPKILPTLMEILPRAFKTVFSFIWQLVQTYYTKIYPALGKTILLTTWNILKTLPTLIWPMLKTVLILVTSLAQTISIVIPKAIETVTLIVITMINAISSYGLDKIGIFLTNMGILLGEAAYHLGNIALMVGGSIGGSLGSAIGNATMAALETLMVDVAAFLRQQFIEPFKHLGFDLPFIDQLEENLAEADKKIKDAISKRTMEQTQEDIDWWTSGIPEAIGKETEALEGIFGEMATLAETEYNNFIAETKPIFSQLGTDIGTIWEGSLSDLGDIWTPALDEIGSVWTDWFNTSGKPIWEGYGTDIGDIWGTALDGIVSDFTTWKEEEGLKIWSDYGLDINEIWGESLGEISTIISGAKEDIGDEFSELLGLLVEETEIQTKSIEDSATAITTAVQNTEEPIATSMANNKTAIVTSMEDAVEPVKDAGEDAAKGYNYEWNTIIDTELKTTFEKIQNILLAQKDGIVNAAREIAKAAVKAMELIFNNFNPSITVDVNYNIPKLNLPSGYTTPSEQYKPPQPPKLAAGGIVGRDQLIRVGEGNTPEMIQPLNEQTLRPFAQMIGGFISNIGTKESDSDYVLVKASKQDLTQLYRSLYVIKKKEEIRGLT